METPPCEIDELTTGPKQLEKDTNYSTVAEINSRYVSKGQKQLEKDTNYRTVAEIKYRFVSMAYVSKAESEQFRCTAGKENIDIACSTRFEAVCVKVQMQ